MFSVFQKGSVTSTGVPVPGQVTSGGSTSTIHIMRHTGPGPLRHWSPDGTTGTAGTYGPSGELARPPPPGYPGPRRKMTPEQWAAHQQQIQPRTRMSMTTAGLCH